MAKISGKENVLDSVSNLYTVLNHIPEECNILKILKTVNVVISISCKCMQISDKNDIIKYF